MQQAGDVPPPDDAAITDFALAVGLLVRRARASMPAEEDLSWTQRAVLKRLEREGPATSAELAVAERIKPQSMGTAVAELVARGLVARRPHPDDRRRVTLRLTAKGVACRKRLSAATHGWLSEAIAQLSPREQQTLFQAGEIMKRLVDLQGGNP